MDLLVRHIHECYRFRTYYTQYVETGPFIVVRGIVLALFPMPEDVVTKVGVSVAPETHSKSYRSVWYHPDIWEQ